MKKEKTVSFDGLSLKLIKSRRKTCSIEVTSDGEITVRAPYYMTERQVKEFIFNKYEWLKKAIEKQERKKAAQKDLEPLQEEDLKLLKEKALSVLPEKVAYYAALMKVSYGKITVRFQKTRWGSCTEEGNLSFNGLLMLMPEEVIDYTVVHELCHRKEMNHSSRFWAEVEKVLPDYKVRLKLQKELGAPIIKRRLLGKEKK